MENTDFIARLEEFVKQEDVLAVSRDVNELRGKFEDYVLEEERKFQVSQLVAEENGEEVPTLETDFGKEAFYAIFDVYKAKKKTIIDERNAIESKNLSEKQALIKRLKGVVNGEENIGAAFASFKEIQDTWKEIGDIPRDQRSDVQKEYSKLLEDFFYNINIYKQLKDHDFHRNHQLKLTVIEKMKELQKEESLKEVEKQLKALQNDWDGIGPVPNEEWERMKESYWTEVRSLYNRVNRFYEDKREEQKENLLKKEALLEELKAMVEGKEELDSTKNWEESTKNVLEIQKRWKTIGFGPKKENDEIWKEFRGVCDTFFDTKKEFYGKVNEVFDGIAAKKKELIDKADELKVSTNWKDSAQQLVQLQKRWKQLGHAGRKNEQKLWKQFRAACDHFFNSRQAHFEEQDKEFEGNLTLKQELLKELEGYVVPEDDKKTALEALKKFSNDFNAIGKVPMKSKDEVYNAFKKIMDVHYGKLKMAGSEKDRIMFEAKIETLKASPNASRALSDIKFDLRKEIDKYKKEVALLENNLGFFANSKGADSLKKDVEKKVLRVHEKIASVKEKIKLIPNE